MLNRILLIVLSSLLIIIMILREFEPFSSTLTDVVFFIVLAIALSIYLYEFLKYLRPN